MAGPWLSVIIPTLNEADYLGYLLFSLSRQTYRNFEVIVSDGSSSDETEKIVKSFKKQLPALTFLVSKRRSPAIQRNEGAKRARFDQLLFLDADVILPADFFAKCLGEIKRRRLDLAHPLTFPLTKRVVDQYFYLIINWGLDLVQNVFPIGGGWTIFSQKKFHREIGGFDERLKKLAEDTDYISRAVKAGARFGIIKSSSPFISVRRLDYEGRGTALKNQILQGIYFGLFGKYQGQEFLKREYGDWRKLLAKRKTTNQFLRRLTKKQFEKFLKSLKNFLTEP